MGAAMRRRPRSGSQTHTRPTCTSPPSLVASVMEPVGAAKPGRELAMGEPNTALMTHPRSRDQIVACTQGAVGIGPHSWTARGSSPGTAWAQQGSGVQKGVSTRALTATSARSWVSLVLLRLVSPKYQCFGVVKRVINHRELVKRVVYHSQRY